MVAKISKASAFGSTFSHLTPKVGAGWMGGFQGVFNHQKLNGTESQRTPFSKLLARAMRYSGLFGVRSVGPVGDFLEYLEHTIFGGP